MSTDRIGGGAGARVAAQEVGAVEAEQHAPEAPAAEAAHAPEQAARTQRPGSVGVGVAALLGRLAEAQAHSAPAAQTASAAQTAPAAPAAPAAQTAAPAAPGATVHRGSTGPDVESLQRQINAQRAQGGLPPIKVDGIFGPETEGAVKAFQGAKGLTQDGVAGPLTWSALGGAPATPSGPSAPSTPHTPSKPSTPSTPARPPAPGPTPSTPSTPSTPATPAGPGASYTAGAPYPHGPQSARQEAVWTRLGMPGRLSISEMPSNGGRPVGVYVPPGLDPSKPVNVVTLFHGHDSSIGEGFERNGLIPNRINELAAQHPNTIFVLPQAGDKPFSYWMKPPKESMAALEQQALGEAARIAGVPSLEVGKRTVSAHSGGGLALRNAVSAGQMKADSIELLDCTYGDWGQTVARWAMQQPADRRPRIESWHTGGDTAAHDAEIARIAPGIFAQHQSPVAHSSIPSRFLGATL